MRRTVDATGKKTGSERRRRGRRRVASPVRDAVVQHARALSAPPPAHTTKHKHERRDSRRHLTRKTTRYPPKIVHAQVSLKERAGPHHHQNSFARAEHPLLPCMHARARADAMITARPRPLGVPRLGLRRHRTIVAWFRRGREALPPSPAPPPLALRGVAATAASIALLLLAGPPRPAAAAEFFDPFGSSIVERYFRDDAPAGAAATATAPSLVDGDGDSGQLEQQQQADDLTLEEFLGIFTLTLGAYVLMMVLASAALVAFGLVDSDDEDDEEEDEQQRRAGVLFGGRTTTTPRRPLLHGAGGLDALLIADPWEEEELELEAFEAEWGGSAGASRLPAAERLGGDPALAYFEATGSSVAPPDPQQRLRRRAARRAAAYVARAVDAARSRVQAKVLARRLGGGAQAAAAAAVAPSSPPDAASTTTTTTTASTVAQPSLLELLIDDELRRIPTSELMAAGGSDGPAVRRVLAGVAARLALDEAVLLVQRTGEAAEALRTKSDGGGGGWGAGEAVESGGSARGRSAATAPDRLIS